MAASPANQKTAHHARSISLPSTSHPLTLAVKEQLNRLRASSEDSSSSSSISHNLAGLKDLYECVEDLLMMQQTKQALSHDSHVLDGSLELLDICSTSMDILLQMKQSAQDLQSSLRRRRDADLANNVTVYMTSRKKISKDVHKCLGDLKRMNNKCFFPLVDKDQDFVVMVSVLKEVEATTLAIFESLLSFLSSSKAGSKQGNWSLVSKLMRTKQRIACNGELENTSELQKVDSTLKTLISHKQYKVEDVKTVQQPLEALEMSIQELEDDLECVFRCLIKTRVSLLNILNQ